MSGPSVAEQRDQLRLENRRLARKKDELTVQNGQSGDQDQ